MSWIRRKLWLLALAVLPTASAGCNPLTLGFLTPIPVQPWTAERLEQKLNHKNDGRVPIMPPIRDGVPPPICEDAPSDAEVLRAMPRVPRGVPYGTRRSATTWSSSKTSSWTRSRRPASSRSSSRNALLSIILM